MPEIYLSGNVCLYNAQGQILRQEVFDENVNDLTWGVNGLPKGLYLAEVRTESGQITRTKVLIQ
ncbi:T9SS type A sorting domain-containing protein [Phaeodactylibacter sp.]|uniref:T9SS type A sorting domain-containing protein n=1 Tax=Phaeodactylibacter sp. TaxID=1940289 RepID=UPI00342ABBF8